MHPEPLIRPGRHEDAENLAALAIQVWLHTYATEGISSTISGYVLTRFTAKQFQTLLDTPSTALFVAEINENLVGYAVVEIGAPCPQPTGAVAELATLYVQAPFIGKGVGPALLAQAELLAQQRTGGALWLTVNAQNNRAIVFYAKHGYSKLGITYFELGGGKYENLVLVGRDVSNHPD